MVLSGDIILRHSLWNDAEEKLCSNLIFERMVDLFIVACTIGIKEDKVLENDINDDEKVKSIGRSTYLMKNEDLTTIITFLYQNAVLNSKLIDYDNETRLRLAFDPDFPDSKSKIQFSPTNFLVKFANYGLSKLLETQNTSDLSFISGIKELLDDMEFKDYSDIIEEINKEIDGFNNLN